MRRGDDGSTRASIRHSISSNGGWLHQSRAARIAPSPGRSSCYTRMARMDERKGSQRASVTGRAGPAARRLARLRALVAAQPRGESSLQLVQQSLRQLLAFDEKVAELFVVGACHLELQFR